MDKWRDNEVMISVLPGGFHKWLPDISVASEFTMNIW